MHFVMVNFLFVLQCTSFVGVVSSSDVWIAMYSAEECIASALLSDAIVANGQCVVGQLSDGTTVSAFVFIISTTIIQSLPLIFADFQASAKFECSGDTEASSWSAGVYLGGT